MRLLRNLQKKDLLPLLQKEVGRCWEDAVNGVIASGWPVKHTQTHVRVKQVKNLTVATCCTSAHPET